MAVPKRKNQPLGLKDLDVLITEDGLTSRYFRVLGPDILTQGKSSFLIGGSQYLRPNVQVKFELVHDITGQVIYTEAVLGHYEAGSRRVSIEIYSDINPGPATLYVAGELDPLRSDVDIPSDWQGIYNVRYARPFQINSDSVNTQPIFFYKQPTLEVSEIFRGYLNVPTIESSSIYLTGSGKPRQGLNPISPVENTDAHGNILGYSYPERDFKNKKNLSIIEENKPINKLSGKKGHIVSQGKLQVQNSAEPNDYLVTVDSNSTVSSLYVGNNFTINNPQVDASRFTLESYHSVPTVYTSSVMKVPNQSTFVPKDVFYVNDTRTTPSTLVPAPLASQFITASYQSLSTQTTSSINYFSFADVEISELRTFSGDVHKVKIYAKSEGSLGDFEQIYDSPIESSEILFDSNEDSLLSNMGYFIGQTRLDKYWEIYEGDDGNGGTGTLTYHKSYIMDSMEISGSNRESEDELRVQVKNNLNFVAGNVYSIRAKLYGIKTPKKDTGGVLRDDAEFSVYLEGDAFTSNDNPDDGSHWGIEKLKVPAIEDNVTQKDFGYIEGNFIADNTGTGKIQFKVPSGKWYLSDISVKAATDTAFNPDYVKITAPMIPLYTRPDRVRFLVEFYDVNNNIADSIIFSDYISFDGQNTAIGGTDNILSGSMYLGDALASGIEMAGVSSAFVRSMGYLGFSSGSGKGISDIPGTGQNSGFLMWSGSVLPDSGDDYKGVGLELVGHSGSYFRFRTNPSELDIRADSFFVGNPNQQFMSGSGGSIEISSSQFHLSGGNATMQGTVTATAGEIGGWTIESERLTAGSGNSSVTMSGTDQLIKMGSGSTFSAAALDGVLFGKDTDGKYKFGIGKGSSYIFFDGSSVAIASEDVHVTASSFVVDSAVFALKGTNLFISSSDGGYISAGNPRPTGYDGANKGVWIQGSNTSDSKTKVLIGDADGARLTFDGDSFILSSSEFYYGSADQYISGSVGNIEISSSNFHLTNTGNVTMTGTITANAGALGGFTIGGGAIASDNFFISGSATGNQYFISSSNFNVKASGDVTASALALTGGEVGGLTVTEGEVAVGSILRLKDSGQITGSKVLFSGGKVGGWTISSTRINSPDSTMRFTSSNPKITMGSHTFGNEGIQLGYDGSSKLQIYAGDGSNNYIKFHEDTGVDIKTSKFELDTDSVDISSANEYLKVGSSNLALTTGSGAFLSGSGEFWLGNDGGRITFIDDTFSLTGEELELDINVLNISASGFLLSSTAPSMSLGNPTPHAYNAGNGFFVDGAGRFLVGSGSGDRIQFDGSNVNVHAASFLLGDSSNFVSGSGGKIAIGAENFSVDKDGNLSIGHSTFEHIEIADGSDILFKNNNTIYAEMNAEIWTIGGATDSTDTTLKVSPRGIAIYQSSNTYATMSAAGFEVIKGGISVADFGAESRVGNPAAEHMSMSSAGMHIKDGSTTRALFTGGGATLGATSGPHISASTTDIFVKQSADDYLKIDSDSVDLYAGGTLYGTFAGTTTIGNTSADHVSITNSGVQLKDGSTVRGQFLPGGITLGVTSKPHISASTTEFYIKESSNQFLQLLSSGLNIWTQGAISASFNAGGFRIGPTAGTHISASTSDIFIKQSANDYLKVDSDSVDVFADGTQQATFAEITKLGDPSNDWLELDSTSVDIYRDSTSIVNLTDTAFRLGGTSNEHIIVDTNGLTIKDSSTVRGKFTGGGATIGVTSGPHISASTTDIFVKQSSDDYLQIDSDSVDIYAGGTKMSEFGSTVYVGDQSNEHIKLSSTGLELKDSSTVRGKFTGGGTTLGVTSGPHISASTTDIFVKQSANDYLQIDSNSVDVYAGGTKMSEFGSTVYVGDQSNEHILISTAGLKIQDGAAVRGKFLATGAIIGETTKPHLSASTLDISVKQSANDYLKIDSDSVDVYANGTQQATFAAITKLGDPSNDWLELDSTSVDIYRASTSVVNLTDSAFRLGGTSNEHIIVDTDGLTIKDSSTVRGKFTAGGATLGVTSGPHISASTTDIFIKQSANDYLKIDSDSVDIVTNGGVSASFTAAGVTIGPTSGPHVSASTDAVYVKQSSNDYVKIDSDSVDIYSDGSETATFGSDATITGGTVTIRNSTNNDDKVVIAEDSFKVYDNNTEKASFGGTTTIGTTGTANPYVEITAGKIKIRNSTNTFMSSSTTGVFTSGSIHAAEGIIGGWGIDSTKIFSDNLYMRSTGVIETSDFASGVKGWRLDSANNGTAEFENVTIRGTLATSVFEKETVNAVGGQLYIANSTVITSSAQTSATETTMSVANVGGFSGSYGDKQGEILSLKKITDTGFSTEYVYVESASRNDPSSDTDFSGKLYVVRGYSGSTPADSSSLGDAASVATTYENGQVIVSTGRINTGYIRLNANPNDDATPYIDIVERTGSAIYDVDLKTRLGDLSGLSSGRLHGTDPATAGFGLYSQNVFLEGGIVANTGSIAGVKMESSKMFTGTGTWGNTNTGFYLDNEASMSLGDKFKWDGTNLVIEGSITLVGGGGFATPDSVSGSFGTQTAISGSVTDLSSSAASALTTVSGSAAASLTSVSGSVASSVAAITSSITAQSASAASSLTTISSSTAANIMTNAEGKIIQTPTVTGTGLFLTATHMGYATNGSWNTYMGNDGQFLFKIDNDNLISYSSASGSSLIVKTNEAVISGSSVSLVTPKFFFGSDAQYISGSVGNIEISSSNFHLQADGDVTMSGEIKATSGVIGGWTITENQLESNNIKINATSGYIEAGGLTNVSDIGDASVGFFANKDGEILLKAGTSANKNYMQFKDGTLDINTDKAHISGSEITLETPKFFLGKKGSQFLSGSNNNIEISSSAYHLSASTFKLGDKLTWDGTDLAIEGSITLTGGSGVATPDSVSGSFGTQTAISGSVTDLSSSAASALTTVSGSAAAALTSVSGSVATSIAAVTSSITSEAATAAANLSSVSSSTAANIMTNAEGKIIQTPAVTGTGLFLTSTHLGYATNGSWNTYMANDGQFLFKIDNDNLISYSSATGSALIIKTNEAVISGSSVSLLAPRFFFGNDDQYVSGSNGNLEISSSAYHLSASTFKLGDKLTWDGTNLALQGSITITGGSGFATPSSVTGSFDGAGSATAAQTAAQNYAQGVGVGAQASASVYSDNAALSASVYSAAAVASASLYASASAVSASGFANTVQTNLNSVSQSTAANIMTNAEGKIIQTPTVTGTGLFLTSTHLGYATNGSWNTYLANDGQFLFKIDNDNLISYSSATGSALIIKTNEAVISGSSVSLVTPKFFFGDDSPGKQYISGSNGNLVISSSNFQTSASRFFVGDRTGSRIEFDNGELFISSSKFFAGNTGSAFISASNGQMELSSSKFQITPKGDAIFKGDLTGASGTFSGTVTINAALAAQISGSSNEASASLAQASASMASQIVLSSAGMALKNQSGTTLADYGTSITLGVSNQAKQTISSTNTTFYDGDGSTERLKITNDGTIDLKDSSGVSRVSITADPKVIIGKSDDNRIEITDSAFSLYEGSTEKISIGSSDVKVKYDDDNYTQMDSNSFDVIVQKATSASFGATTTIGPTSANHVSIDGSSISIKNASTTHLSASSAGLYTSGHIHASHGTVGGFLISSDTLTSTNVGIGKTGQNQAFWAGSDTQNSAAFRVAHDGTLVASTANIAGTVSASLGNIGGWTLGTGILKSANTTGTIDGSTYTATGMVLLGSGAIASKNFYIDTSGNAFFKGDITGASGNFTGDLTGASGNFTGDLNATHLNVDSGSIGSWTLADGYIYGLRSGTPTSSPNDGMVLKAGIAGSTTTVSNISVYENTEKRIEFGGLGSGKFGLIGYADNGSDKIFELSDTQQMLAGWEFNDEEIKKVSATGGIALKVVSSQGKLIAYRDNETTAAVQAGVGTLSTPDAEVESLTPDQDWGWNIENPDDAGGSRSYTNANHGTSNETDTYYTAVQGFGQNLTRVAANPTSNSQFALYDTIKGSYIPTSFSFWQPWKNSQGNYDTTDIQPRVGDYVLGLLGTNYKFMWKTHSSSTTACTFNFPVYYAGGGSVLNRGTAKVPTADYSGKLIKISFWFYIPNETSDYGYQNLNSGISLDNVYSTLKYELKLAGTGDNTTKNIMTFADGTDKDSLGVLTQNVLDQKGGQWIKVTHTVDAYDGSASPVAYVNLLFSHAIQHHSDPTSYLTNTQMTIHVPKIYIDDFQMKVVDKPSTQIYDSGFLAYQSDAESIRFDEDGLDLKSTLGTVDVGDLRTATLNMSNERGENPTIQPSSTYRSGSALVIQGQRGFTVTSSLEAAPGEPGGDVVFRTFKGGEGSGSSVTGDHPGGNAGNFWFFTGEKSSGNNSNAASGSFGKMIIGLESGSLQHSASFYSHSYSRGVTTAGIWDGTHPVNILPDSPVIVRHYSSSIALQYATSESFSQQASTKQVLGSIKYVDGTGQTRNEVKVMPAQSGSEIYYPVFVSQSLLIGGDIGDPNPTSGKEIGKLAFGSFTAGDDSADELSPEGASIVAWVSGSGINWSTSQKRTTLDFRVGTFDVSAPYVAEPATTMRIIANGVTGNPGSIQFLGRITGDILPYTSDYNDLGSTSYRWKNLYTTDLQLSNLGREEGNKVDGTKGDWTLQEGEEDLFVINNVSGKKYKIALIPTEEP